MAVKRASEKTQCGGVLATDESNPKCCESASMHVYPRRTNRQFRCRRAPLRDYATARLDDCAAGEGSRLRCVRTRTAAENDGSSPSPRDRHRARLESRPVGSLAAGPGDDTRRTESSRRRVRVADRSAGSDDSNRSGDGRPAQAYSRRSSTRSSGNVYAPVSSMPGRAGSGSAVLQRLPSNQPKYASCIAPASPRPKSPDGSTSDARQCAAFLL